MRKMRETAAAVASKWFEWEIRREGTPYRMVEETTEEMEEREAEIHCAMDERIFDIITDGGIRDWDIVVECMARGYDIVSWRNVPVIDHGMLRHWVREGAGKALGVTTEIYRPDEAEEALRKAKGKPIEWTAHAAARACVSDPEDREGSKREILELLAPLGKRGMGEIEDRVRRMIREPTVLEEALETVRERGNSRAAQAERELKELVVKKVEKLCGERL